MQKEELRYFLGISGYFRIHFTDSSFSCQAMFQRLGKLVDHYILRKEGFTGLDIYPVSWGNEILTTNARTLHRKHLTRGSCLHLGTRRQGDTRLSGGAWASHPRDGAFVEARFLRLWYNSVYIECPHWQIEKRRNLKREDKEWEDDDDGEEDDL